MVTARVGMLVVAGLAVADVSLPQAQPRIDGEQIRAARDEVYRSERLQHHLPTADRFDIIADSGEDDEIESKRQDDEADTSASQEGDEQERGEPLTIDQDKARTYFWLILGALVLGIGLSFLWNKQRSGRDKREASEKEIALDDQETGTTDLVLSADAPPEDSIHAYLLRGIGLLQTHGKFRPRPGLTAREILEDARLEPSTRAAFAALVRGVELTRFGRVASSADRLQASRDAFAALGRSLTGMADG